MDRVVHMKLAHIGAVFVHEPHAGINHIVRPLVTERDRTVVEWSIDRLQPLPGFVDHRARAVLQVDAKQPAAWTLEVEPVKLLPIGQRHIAACHDLDTTTLSRAELATHVP